MLNNSKTIIADSLYVYNEATESLIDVNDSLNNTGSAIDQEILDRKADKTEVSQLLATKLNITTYTTKITDINTTLSTKLNISDFNSTNATNLNLINLKVNTTDLNSTMASKLDIIDFNNFKISNNSELNAKQGIFYSMPPLYFSANFELNRMELILSEEEISQMTHFYNKTYIDTFTTDNNATLSSLLTNINSRVLTTDYNLKISDINTSLGSKLNISDNNATLSSLLTNINSRVLTTDYNLKVADINTTLGTKLNITDINATVSSLLTNINSRVLTTDYNLKVSDINTTLGTKLNITDINATVSSLLTNINSRVLTTDYNLKVSDINTTLGTKLNISDNNATVSSLLTNINSRVLTTDYNLKVSDINTTLGSKLNISDNLNNAAAWSSGLASDSYHYINTGSEALVVRNNMAPYDVYMNILNTTGTILAYKNFEVLGSASFKTIYSTLNDHVYINDNLVVSGSISCNSIINYDSSITINSKLSKKLDVDIYDTLRTIYVTGNGALFVFQSNKLPELSYNMMSLDVENLSGDNYTTNTVLIQRANINTLWLNNKIVVNSGNITITGTELSYLDNVSSNLQTQLNNKLSVEVFPAAKSINLSGNSLFTIKTFKDAMTGYVDVFTIDVIDNLGYGSNSVIIGQNLGIVGDLMVMEHAQLQSTTNIYTSSNLNQNYITSSELYNMKSSTSNIQTQINSKAPINNPTFTGTVGGITKSMVGLSNVDNTSDANKPISTATQTALNTKNDIYHVAFQVYAAGTIIRNYGKITINNSDIDTSGGNGNYKITMSTPHPLGASYGIIATCNGASAGYAAASIISSTQFTILTYNSAGTAANIRFTCHTMD